MDWLEYAISEVSLLLTEDIIIPIMKEEPNTIILHVGTNDATSKTSR